MKEVKERTKNRYAIWDHDKKLKDNLTSKEVSEYFGKANTGFAGVYSSKNLLYKKRYKIVKTGEVMSEKAKKSYDFKKEWNKARFAINPNVETEGDNHG